MSLNANPGIHREAAVLAGQHLLGIKALDQAAPDEGAQDAGAGSGLRLGHGSLVKAAGRVKVHIRRYCENGFVIARYRLKHPINHADMGMHMAVQAGVETVDKGHIFKGMFRVG